MHPLTKSFVETSLENPLWIREKFLEDKDSLGTESVKFSACILHWYLSSVHSNYISLFQPQYRDGLFQLFENVLSYEWPLRAASNHTYQLYLETPADYQAVVRKTILDCKAEYAEVRELANTTTPRASRHLHPGFVVDVQYLKTLISFNIQPPLLTNVLCAGLRERQAEGYSNQQPGYLHEQAFRDIPAWADPLKTEPDLYNARIEMNYFQSSNLTKV